MYFPVTGFLLLGCVSLSSCESVHPKLSAAVTKAAKGSDTEVVTKASKGGDAEADLDALDAAIGVVDKRIVKTQKKDETKKATVAVKKDVKKARKIHWVASASKKSSKMPEVDVQKSKMFQKEKNLVISKEAEEVLAKGDAKAHELEHERHQRAVEKVALAKVVHVSSAGAGKGDAVQDARDLESDLHDLKQRIAADDKHQEEVKKQEAEEAAERAARKDKQEQQKIQKPEKQADLNKLMTLSNEMVNDAKAAPQPKASAVFLQQEPKDGIRSKSGIDDAAADLEATVKELASHPHAQKKKIVTTPSNPRDQQYGALSHLKDSILKAKKAQDYKLREEKIEMEKHRKAQAEAAEDAEALSGTVPAVDDPRLKEVKVTHVKHLSPEKLKSLKAAVGRMQDSVYVEPAPVKNMITDLKSGEENVVEEPKVHMHARDGFGERPAPQPKLPPAPKVLPALPMAPPNPDAPKPKPPSQVSESHEPHHFQESPLAPTVVMTTHAQPASQTAAPKKLSPVEENAKKFEKVMHQNVVSMHAALRESTKETQEQLASQLAAKKRAEEAKLAREMQTAEEKKQKIEQKEKAAALRKEEEQKAEEERNFAHQQVLDYRAAQRKARQMKEEEMMKKKKAQQEAEREAKHEAQEKQVHVELKIQPKEEVKQTSDITDQEVVSQLRPSQFVSSQPKPPTTPSEDKPSKSSAFTQTLGIGFAFAMGILCSW